MKLRDLTLALSLAGLLSACDQVPKTVPEQSAGSSAAASAPTVQDTSAVVATVNGTPITEAMLNLYSEQRQGSRPGADSDREAILQEIVNLELARQQGEQQGVDKTLDVALQIEQQRRAVIATAAIKKQLEDNPVTDEEVRKIYDENVGTGDEYKARHILVKEQDEAMKVIEELDKGADFSELAKERSTGPSGKNGGELGWFASKQMVAPFSEAVAKLEKGAYTKEPVQTQFGWHVIILDDSRQSTPPDFEMLKPQIAGMVQNQRVQDYITQLRENATIEIVQAEQPAAAEESTPAEESAPADAAPETPATDTAEPDAAPAAESIAE